MRLVFSAQVNCLFYLSVTSHGGRNDKYAGCLEVDFIKVILFIWVQIASFLLLHFIVKYMLVNKSRNRGLNVY